MATADDLIKYIVGNGVIWKNGEPVEKVMHANTSIYDIVDTMMKKYPEIASIIAEYPALCKYIAKYSGLAKIIYEYQDTIPTILGNPTILEYLFLKKEPDKEYPLISETKLYTNMDTTSDVYVSAFFNIKEFPESEISILSAGTWGSAAGIYASYKPNQGIMFVSGTNYKTYSSPAINTDYEIIFDSAKKQCSLVKDGVYTNYSFSNSFYGYAINATGNIYIGTKCLKIIYGGTTKAIFYPIGSHWFEALSKTMYV